MYVYFLCGLVCICIHESDAELICMWVFFFCLFFVLFFVLFVFCLFVCLFVCFFSDVLTYCVMLQDFLYYSYVSCL